MGVRRQAILAVVACLLVAFGAPACSTSNQNHAAGASSAQLDAALSLAEQTAVSGLNAGTKYPQIWIRDLNTFLPLYLLAGGDPAAARAALVRFASLQEPDGAIPDGYLTTQGSPGYTVFTNSVESDQESSFVQALYEYVSRTGDKAVLDQEVNGETVASRAGAALRYLLGDRFDTRHGLAWSGVTVDWGDVQVGQGSLVALGPNSARGDSIYTNAMLSLALKDMSLLAPAQASTWLDRRSALDTAISEWLWDSHTGAYRQHVFVTPSPLVGLFDESGVYYTGGTAEAALAGLLSPKEILRSFDRMETDAKDAKADSIGLDIYPFYPSAVFPSSARTLMSPGSYQNGGDWDWFGARMVQALVAAGDVSDARNAIAPMVLRALKYGGYWEWWNKAGEPEGSSGYRGAAGEMGLAIEEILQSGR